MPTAQNFRNHARIVPAYHVGVFVPFLANFIWAAYRLVRMFNGETFIAFLVSIADLELVPAETSALEEFQFALGIAHRRAMDLVVMLAEIIEGGRLQRPYA